MFITTIVKEFLKSSIISTFDKKAASWGPHNWEVDWVNGNFPIFRVQGNKHDKHRTQQMWSRIFIVPRQLGYIQCECHRHFYWRNNKKNKLETLECAKAVCLWLTLVNFSYLSLPFLTFGYLNLTSFPYKFIGVLSHTKRSTWWLTYWFLEKDRHW